MLPTQDKKARTIKLIRYFSALLYSSSIYGIMGAGFAFITVLCILSLAQIQGIPVEAKIDISSLTQGGYIYLWFGIFSVYVIGFLIKAIIKLRNMS